MERLSPIQMADAMFRDVHKLRRYHSEARQTMGPLEVLKDVTAKLSSRNIEYFLVGSLAAMQYGRPRFTNDIDLVVEIRPSQLRDFAELFKIDEYYCPPPEILRDEVVRMGSFNLIHQSTGMKVDVVVLKNTEFYLSEFSRRKKITLAAGVDVFIASAEDVIIKKLDFYREGGSEKHLTDIREIVAATPLDQRYLDKWIDHFGLREQWGKI